MNYQYKVPTVGKTSGLEFYKTAMPDAEGMNFLNSQSEPQIVLQASSKQQSSPTPSPKPRELEYEYGRSPEKQSSMYNFNNESKQREATDNSPRFSHGMPCN